MNILALETTEAIGTVAALVDDNLLAEFELNSGQRSAQSLAPGIRDLLDRVGWKPSDVDLVGVTIGPGSFTGLRVGVTTAKTFAYAAGADILGLDTLEVIAAAAPSDVEALAVAVDAQRGQVVAGGFRRDARRWLRPAGPPQRLDLDSWFAGLPDGAYVTGPVLRKIGHRVPDRLRRVASDFWSPTAAVVGRLAARDCTAGSRHDVWRLVPRYWRQSAAEEKWSAKQP